MKNKTGIIILAALITFFCAYFISFTFISRDIDKQATNFATNTDGKLDIRKKQEYVDSIWNQPVIDFLGAEFTYKEVKQNELNLGLDLQGGMHVVLEVSPNEIIKAMAGRNADASLVKSLKAAREAQKSSQERYVDLFYQSFKAENPNKKLSEIFSNTANQGRISYDTPDEEVIKILSDEVDKAVHRSLTILRTRIDKFGVSQPNMQQLRGTNRIQVELPGVDNPTRVRKLLQGVAKLEFLEVYDNRQLVPALNDLNDYLYEKEEAEKALATDNDSTGEGDQTEKTEDLNDLLAASSEDVVEEIENADSDTTVVEEELVAENEDASDDSTTSLEEQLTSAADDTTSQDSVMDQARVSKLFTLLYQRPGDNGFSCRALDTAEVMTIFNRSDVQAYLPRDSRILFNYKELGFNDNGEAITKLFFVKEPRTRDKIEGDVIVNAGFGIDNQTGRGYEITMRMNSEGAKKWRRMTQELSQEVKTNPRFVAAVLDDMVYSAPTISEPIPNGSSRITGSFTKDEASDLANVLKAGSLPAPLRIVEETVVGPSIGQEAIDKGLLSIGAGLVLVILFMILYYSKGGFVADLALFINIFFIVGILANLGSSLTLPGIAGIVLTIGMSIDANVLIFERIKEEMAMGRKRLAAIEMGYKKAYSAIIDSNVTTFLVGIILFTLGSGPVKGFAVTLMIGIASSFFSAVFISRLVIEYMSRKSEGENLSFDTFISRGLLQNVEFDFVRRRKMAYILSALLIIVGFSTVFMQGGWNMGVDFKGGRSYVVDFKNVVSVSDVRNTLKDNFEDAGTEVKTFGQDNRLKITTSYLADEESAESDKKVEEALMAGLSNFSDSNPEVQSSSKVGATIADDIKNTSQTSVVIALIVIFLYILVRFRKWQFGLGAIIALFHDVLMVLGIFSIVRLFGLAYEVDQVFIAAMLTIIGYSINDTVVVFDRVREFLIDRPSADIADTFNKSINSTLNRTLMTSVTTLLVVIVLFVFGGEALRGFSFSLLIGIFFGTYSSIFIATPVVLDTAMRKMKKNQKQMAEA